MRINVAESCEQKQPLFIAMSELSACEVECAKQVANDPEHLFLIESTLNCPGRDGNGNCGLKKILAQVITVGESVELPEV